MRYIWQHIKTIIDTYNGGIPLAHFLKNYMKLQPKLGSRDRRILNEMAYCWYRCEKGFDKEIPFDEKMRLCLAVGKASSKHIETFLPEDKDALQNHPFDIEQIFPHPFALSEGIVKDEWLHSMLQQPNLFIRIRKDKEKITGLLKEHDIPFEFITDTCLSLPNGAAIDKILPEESYVVQDASSQETGSYFHPEKGELWYDSCAGAGGKSLLLKDIEPAIKLTVSDTRETILHNLNSRFQLYKHHRPTAQVVDVADKKQLGNMLNRQRFDNIICDVPCSGSGTWARTPEQLYFFDTAIVQTLPALQQAIAVNASAYLNPGGRLFYITCSVFVSENEKVVNEILSASGLTVEQQVLLNGIQKHADSMFITVFKK